MSDPLLDHAIAELQQLRSLSIVPCKICSGDALRFDVVDFNKSCAKEPYVLGFRATPVVYRRCTTCHFIFTTFGDSFSSSEWETYVYNKDYVTVDPDYLSARPRHNAREIASFLLGARETIVGLDYGGGNGKTAALLREHRWTFDSYDPYGAATLSEEHRGHYNFCSAIEVFEHTPDPVGTLYAMLSMASSDKLLILIGTATHDGHVTDQSRLAWWYAAPRNGHVSLHSRRSLQTLAERFCLTYAGDVNGTTHLLARGYTLNNLHALLMRGKLTRRLRTTLRLWQGSLAGA